MTDTAQTEQAPFDAGTPAEEYAIVEIFGHRRHAGRILEVERFGTKLLRVDVPKDGDFANGYTTHQYGGGALFSVTPCDLATVQRINAPYAPPARLTYREPEEPEDAQRGEPAIGDDPDRPF